MKYCVLILDDQPESTMVLRALLERRDFHCVAARTIAEADQLLNEVMPHLLVVDHLLSGKENGLDWLKKVRAGPMSHIPAVILTGNGDGADIRKYTDLGIEDYIIKPGTPATLTRKIVAIHKNLQTLSLYACTFAEQTAPADVRLTMRINALSETGLCVSSDICNRLPFTVAGAASDLFVEMGVPAPQKITFLNYESERNGLAKMPFRNYCQVKGWTEGDFQKVRIWIRKNQLGRSF
jgi:CheY-like chemotaxis protein